MLDPQLNLPKLKEELDELFDESSQIFAWNSRSKEICSSSIAKYFSDCGRCVRQCSNKLSVKNVYGLKFSQIPPDCDEQNFAEISESIAMALLECNVEPTDFSSYQMPEASFDIGRGKVIHIKGLIGEVTIKLLIDEVQLILDENPSFPWIAISLESKLLVVSKTSIIQYS